MKVSPRGQRDYMFPLPMAVRRWHIVFAASQTICISPWIQKSRRIYVRPRTGPQSAHLCWPAVAKLQAASVPTPRQLRHGTDRRTDCAIPKCRSRVGAQSCPWVGLTSGLGWVGWTFFSFLRVVLGWVHYSKNTKHFFEELVSK